MIRRLERLASGGGPEARRRHQLFFARARGAVVLARGDLLPLELALRAELEREAEARDVVLALRAVPDRELVALRAVPVLLRAVDLRPVLFRVPLRAVDLRLVPLRAVVFFFAVVFLRAVLFRAVVFFFAVVFLRAVLLRPPLDLAAPPPIDPPPPIGDGGMGGVPEGCGAGQIDPGCFCADQSVPVFSSSMRPPQISFALGEVLCVTCHIAFRTAPQDRSRTGPTSRH